MLIRMIKKLQIIMGIALLNKHGDSPNRGDSSEFLCSEITV